MAESGAERQPWDQQPGESGPAFRAFQFFRDLAPVDRSLAKVTEALAARQGDKGRRKGADQALDRRPKKASGCVRGWSKKFRWDERADAYDRFISAARDKARVKHVESAELKRAKQMAQQEEETLVAASQLKLKAFQMLSWALERTTEESRTISADGHTTVIQRTIEPAGWRLRDAAWFLKTARELEDLVYRPEVFSGPNAAAAPLPAQTAVRPDRTGAEERLEDWRARMRGRMLQMPGSPPGKPEDEPGANGHQANGSGH